MLEVKLHLKMSPLKETHSAGYNAEKCQIRLQLRMWLL